MTTILLILTFGCALYATGVFCFNRGYKQGWGEGFRWNDADENVKNNNNNIQKM